MIRMGNSFEWSSDPALVAALSDDGDASLDSSKDDGQDVHVKAVPPRRQPARVAADRKQPEAKLKLVYLTLHSGPKTERYRLALRWDADWMAMKRAVESRLSLPEGVAEVESLRSGADGALLRHCEDIMEGESVTVRIKMLHPPDPEKGRPLVTHWDQRTLKELDKISAAEVRKQQQQQQQQQQQAEENERSRWVHSTNPHSKALRGHHHRQREGWTSAQVPPEWINSADEQQQQQQQKRLHRPASAPVCRPAAGDSGSGANNKGNTYIERKLTNHEKVSAWVANRRSGSNGRSDSERLGQQRREAEARPGSASLAAARVSGTVRGDPTGRRGRLLRPHRSSSSSSSSSAAAAAASTTTTTRRPTTTATPHRRFRAPTDRMDPRQRQTFRQIDDPRSNSRSVGRERSSSSCSGVGGGGGGGGSNDFCGAGDEAGGVYKAQVRMRAERRKEERFRQLDLAEYEAAEREREPAERRAATDLLELRTQQWGAAPLAATGSKEEEPAAAMAAPKTLATRAEGGTEAAAAATAEAPLLYEERRGGPCEDKAASRREAWRQQRQRDRPRRRPQQKEQLPAWQPTRMCQGGSSMKTFSELYPLFLHDGKGGPSLTRAHHKFTHGGTSGL